MHNSHNRNYIVKFHCKFWWYKMTLFMPRFMPLGISPLGFGLWAIWLTLPTIWCKAQSHCCKAIQYHQQNCTQLYLHYTTIIYAQLLCYTLYAICQKDQHKSTGAKAVQKMMVKLIPTLIWRMASPPLFCSNSVSVLLHSICLSTGNARDPWLGKPRQREPRIQNNFNNQPRGYNGNRAIHIKVLVEETKKNIEVF